MAENDLKQVPTDGLKRNRYALVLFTVVFLFVFRAWIPALPDIISGKLLIAADEFIPMYNLQSQFADLIQPEAIVSPLTNEQEFRIRYSFSTIIFRYFRTIPFAIWGVCIITAYLAFSASFRLIRRVFPDAESGNVRLVCALSSLFLVLLIVYQKLLNFPVLVFGWGLLAWSVLLLLQGIFLGSDRQTYKSIIASALLALINPAPHFVAIYCILAVLCAMYAIIFYTNLDRQALRKGCIAVAACFLFTVIPYFLFVKFYVIQDIRWAKELPMNFYSIRDSSLPLLNQLAFESTSIINKITYGTYQPPFPHLPNIAYFLLLLSPLCVRSLRAQWSANPQVKHLFIFLYCTLLFSMWATIGFVAPWFPSMHNILAWGMHAIGKTHSLIIDRGFEIIFQVIQILRQPHRFQFITYLTTLFLLPIGCMPVLRIVQSKLPKAGTWVFSLLFFVPLLSYPLLRQTFFSGDYNGMFRPFPSERLAEVKTFLHSQPLGKTIVIPPTTTSKLIYSENGTAYRIMDRFFIHYLDVPSIYYSLDSGFRNQASFFLFWRAFYQNRNWWVNVARNQEIKYIVWNKEMGPALVGVEYMRGLEKFGLSKLESASPFVKKIFENQSYVIFEFIDQSTAKTEKGTAYDLNWSDFVCMNEASLDFGKEMPLFYSHLQYEDASQITTVMSDDKQKTTWDLYAQKHRERFLTPDIKTSPFDPHQIPSSMFLDNTIRALGLLRFSIFNRFNIVHPANYDTLTGTYLGVNGPSVLRFKTSNIPAGTYSVVLRGIATKNSIELATTSTLRSKEIENGNTRVKYFASADQFKRNLQLVDVSNLTEVALSKLIPQDIIPIASGFSYIPLGTVVFGGSEVITLAKTDGNPLIVEGILFLPIDKRDIDISPTTIQ